LTQLPDQMPEGCNFYAVLETHLAPDDVAQGFGAAGWTLTHSGGASRLDIAWGRLNLRGDKSVVLWGWLDRPDDRVDKVLALLGGSGLTRVSSQWINAAGRLWRDMPFDESMLDPGDHRLPAHIKASMLASSAEAASARQPAKAAGAREPRKPWWRFW
jgi:hypothetical protein